MDVNLSVESGLNFFRDHALWSALIALGIGALVYWKPKGMLRLARAIYKAKSRRSNVTAETSSASKHVPLEPITVLLRRNCSRD